MTFSIVTLSIMQPCITILNARHSAFAESHNLARVSLCWALLYQSSLCLLCHHVLSSWALLQRVSLCWLSWHHLQRMMVLGKSWSFFHFVTNFETILISNFVAWIISIFNLIKNINLTLAMDKCQLTEQNLGWVFNFRIGNFHAAYLWCYLVKPPNL